MEIIKGLNEQQREAVLSTEGPVLVVAGAGSGKTRLLVHRIAYLIKEKKVSPRQILAVTFTNKAAEEMKERIKKLLVGDFRFQPWMGTFHHICVRILRSEIDKIGYKKNFVIYDDSDQRALVKKIMKENEISAEQFNPRAMLAVISKAKGELMKVEDYISGESYFERIVARVYGAYQKNLLENNALDFDDILQKTVELFQKFPDILEKYQNVFRYILVDEYQDTNQAQYVLVNLLAQRHRNLCVVGDDWQSIYAFRGADVRNILDFEKDYPEAKVVKLERNYRSTQKILDAAYGVISKNIRRKDKKLWTDNIEGHDVVLYKASDEQDEAGFIIREIQRIVEEEGLSLDDFVVLYRTNAQSRAIEEAFLESAVPYRVVGGVRFYERREIKDFLAYLRFISNPTDEISLGRIVNLPPRGIGNITLGKWIRFTRENNLDFVASAKKTGDICGLNGAKMDAIAKFGAQIERLRSEAGRATIIDLMDSILTETGYQKLLLSEGEVGQIRFENVRELFTVAEKYKKEEGLEGLNMFLEEVALMASTDNIDSKSGLVHLMTLHSAKGLEFNTVFIAGMEEGLFPHSRALLDERELEEERRLAYVGITRAKKRIYLLWATTRNIFGSTRVNVASRFLDDIPAELKADFEEFRAFPKVRKGKAGLFEEKKEKSLALEKFKDGERVRHSIFGEGIVISTKDDIVTVAFMKEGLKKISAKFGKLKKI
ncbi:MAG: ATP-dependent DNA helicase PcrA [Candidatus Moranbacteria bacterium GW2011_GWC1_45_18]|nr:MAG: ATP-dependent DNA helicase PcrA [Candidatus Moranbacteria bacterium GW2011_GWC2_40_12]KKT32629.1 MAG: ATP-dependent DNA helicase PcrA [Candidatus Moranbacteria bacterium GW2011_GWF2_44_10]KKU00736.1 MAG: ATP-dependent DNA helicase PcrA [Candidatus Moranbacteria bacterium GW2011_GWC1_45_18]OGI35263.1 MAG: ATP-dependent DNA helicase PcrA [Candidatus Moranbacteria bacterium RIFOXYC1_FULL_44_8]OGI39950.1 MAG: ATP-dependent DNA helicase PcrA [Candidatus Moranbacteria bacterium RIFOXYB1_FULL_